MSTATKANPTTITTTKSYAAKSSVMRAATKQHPQFKKEQIEIGTNEDGYYWANKAALLAPAKAVPTGVKARKFSTVVSPCKLVWDIAGEMEGSPRKDIIAACQLAGVAFYTARTQYQKYTEAKRGIIK